jgi:hypothetical protein
MPTIWNHTADQSHCLKRDNNYKLYMWVKSKVIVKTLNKLKIFFALFAQRQFFVPITKKTVLEISHFPPCVRFNTFNYRDQHI